MGEAKEIAAMKRVFRALALACAASTCSLAGCSVLSDLPRDARLSTSTLRSGQPLCVGVPGHVEKQSGSGDARIAAREKEVVTLLARRLGTRVEWKRGSLHELAQELERGEVLMVAAQLPCDTPFADKVALSQPFLKHGPREEDFCLAVAPGENKLLLELDRLIAQEQRKRA